MPYRQQGSNNDLIGSSPELEDSPDALNYMGAARWTLENAFSINTHLVPQVYYFYFRKLFSKVDVLKAEKYYMNNLIRGK